MVFASAAAASLDAAQPPAGEQPWPALSSQVRPWAYWWWMGSAVDKTNLTRELQRYHDGGLGGVHIIPIYGARGWEDRYITYLSPQWMELLSYTVSEAQRLGMGVDMTTGSGWCFGGPQVTDQEANASVVVKTFDVAPGQPLKEKLDRKSIQALVAFGPDGICVDLTDKLGLDGTLAPWDGSLGARPSAQGSTLKSAAPPNPRQGAPAEASWKLVAVSQKPSGQKVKRAAPGGEGHMLNLIYPEAVRHYLRWFDDAFARYTGPKPRTMYHDSYEYRSDWAPDFFAQFEKRRGYRLQAELPALFGSSSVRLPALGAALDADRLARVKCDYRETISDIMAEESLPLWAKWSREHGFLTRNEAHGSPGNWLDLYAAADIPETEMFYRDRNKLISKFASSAAHVTGKNRVASETGTWLKEHFTETLGDMKYLLDDLFLSGINHVFYHGTCYSPDEAGWPGWHFYASFEMNPRNSIWRDVPALNAYAARCQALLQAGRPDNDILVYWPIHDFWQSPTGLVRQFTVHARDWFEDQPIGQLAEPLWNRGYSFDYVSDRQLAEAAAADGKTEVPGGSYRAIVVPSTRVIPLESFRKLLALAQSGATIVFQGQLPEDVPGWGNLKQRREEFKRLLQKVQPDGAGPFRTAKIGKGRLLVGEVEPALVAAKVPREVLFDHPGLMGIRRRLDDGACYFIANRGDRALEEWVGLASVAEPALILDPMTGQSGQAKVRRRPAGQSEVYLQLEPGESLFVRGFEKTHGSKEAWHYWRSSGPATTISATWRVRFLEGGPELPSPFEIRQLGSWTASGDTNAARFAGTALYSVTFDAPAGSAEHWWLDLGRVCQSARVRLNGQDLGTLIIPPFRSVAGALKPKGNLLEVEVTNVSANRIRDLDRRDVKWKTFHDINFVNLDYRPFDASNWPLTDSGLLGPVTLTPVTAAAAPASASGQ